MAALAGEPHARVHPHDGAAEADDEVREGCPAPDDGLVGRGVHGVVLPRLQRQHGEGCAVAHDDLDVLRELGRARVLEDDRGVGVALGLDHDVGRGPRGRVRAVQAHAHRLLEHLTRGEPQVQGVLAALPRDGARAILGAEHLTADGGVETRGGHVHPGGGIHLDRHGAGALGGLVDEQGREPLQVAELPVDLARRGGGEVRGLERGRAGGSGLDGHVRLAGGERVGDQGLGHRAWGSFRGGGRAAARAISRRCPPCSSR